MPFFHSSPFSVQTAGQPPLRAVPLHTLQGCGLTGSAPPGAEQRGVQDAESPAGETAVNLAVST